MNRFVHHLICPALLLLAGPLWAGSVSRTSKDFNHDGHVDQLTVTRDGGSGYRSIERCIRDGASKRKACVSVETTAYGMFAGVTQPRPAQLLPASLMAQLKAPKCVPASAKDPAQAAMWALAKAEPSGDNIQLSMTAATSPGLPQAVPAVCLSHKQAKTLRGAFAWDAAGSARQKAVTGQSILFPASAPPKRVLKAGRFHVYVITGAVAVHDTRSNKHRWLVSFADGADEGFKIDRWKRLDDFKRTRHGFRFDVRRAGAAASVVNVALPK